jgi:hypothetical protein
MFALPKPPVRIWGAHIECEPIWSDYVNEAWNHTSRCVDLDVFWNTFLGILVPKNISSVAVSSVAIECQDAIQLNSYSPSFYHQKA